MDELDITPEQIEKFDRGKSGHRHQDCEKLPTPLGRYLAHNRALRDMSLNELGRRSDLDVGAISRIESGSTANPSVTTLRALAKGLNVPLSEVYQAAGIVTPDSLPDFDTYLREKHGKTLSPDARRQLEDMFESLADDSNIDPYADDEDDERPMK